VQRWLIDSIHAETIYHYHAAPVVVRSLSTGAGGDDWVVLDLERIHGGRWWLGGSFGVYFRCQCSAVPAAPYWNSNPLVVVVVEQKIYCQTICSNWEESAIRSNDSRTSSFENGSSSSIESSCGQRRKA
jgi:hypothetical protein